MYFCRQRGIFLIQFINYSLIEKFIFNIKYENGSLDRAKPTSSNIMFSSKLTKTEKRYIPRNYQHFGEPLGSFHYGIGNISVYRRVQIDRLKYVQFVFY